MTCKKHDGGSHTIRSEQQVSKIHGFTQVLPNPLTVKFQIQNVSHARNMWLKIGGEDYMFYPN